MRRRGKIWWRGSGWGRIAVRFEEARPRKGPGFQLVGEYPSMLTLSKFTKKRWRKPAGRVPRRCSKNVIFRHFDGRWVILQKPVYTDEGELLVAEVVASSVSRARLLRRVRITIRSPLILMWVRQPPRDRAGYPDNLPRRWGQSLPGLYCLAPTGDVAASHDGFGR